MSIFDDLRQLYISWDDAGQAYEREVNGYFAKFGQGFTDYLGVPPPYRLLHPQIGGVGCYVELITPDDQEESGYRLASPVDCVTRGKDGFFTGHLKLALDRQSNAFPKLYLTFNVHFLLTPDECVMDFGDHDQLPALHLKRSGDNPNGPAYEHMVGMLKRMLSHKPWDVTPQSAPIGFSLQKG